MAAILIDYLADAESGQKVLSAKTLSRYGVRRVPPGRKLTALLQDTDPPVKVARESTLSRIVSKQAFASRRVSGA